VKIDGVTMPRMKLTISYFNKTKKEDNARGTTLIQVIALRKRNLSYSCKGMLPDQISLFLGAVVGKASVVIEDDDPDTGIPFTATCEPLTPEATKIWTRSGIIKGWGDVKFSAVEL
jgi:hypothetical protein